MQLCFDHGNIFVAKYLFKSGANAFQYKEQLDKLIKKESELENEKDASKKKVYFDI